MSSELSQLTTGEIELQDLVYLLVDGKYTSYYIKETDMNEVSQALQFLAQSLIAKDRAIEELQKQIAELQKQVQAAMATQAPQTPAV
jgi:hypothetical protein